MGKIVTEICTAGQGRNKQPRPRLNRRLPLSTPAEQHVYPDHLNSYLNHDHLTS